MGNTGSEESREDEKTDNSQNQYDPTIVHTKDFPEQFHNEFNILPSYEAQNYGTEAVFKGEKDKRKPYDTNGVDFYSRVGQLNMTYNGLKSSYIGTATVFYVDDENNRAYAITAGHNLIHYNKLNKTTHKMNGCWFDRRITNKGWLRSSSNSIKVYKVDKKWIHPSYDPKLDISSYDLAVISFIDEDGCYFSSNKKTSKLNNISIGFYDNPEYSFLTKAAATAGGAVVGAGVGAVMVSAAAPTTAIVATGTSLQISYASMAVMPVLAATAATGTATATATATATTATAATATAATTAGATVGYTLPNIFGFYSKFNGLAIIGYPGEKKGELWGEILHVQSDADCLYNKECKMERGGKMISYNIHTSGGQSGSCIVKSNNGVIKIVGIHTNTNTYTKNYGVVLDKKNIKWIMKCILVNGKEKDKQEILQFF